CGDRRVFCRDHRGDHSSLAVANQHNPLGVNAGLCPQPRDFGLHVIGFVEAGELSIITGGFADAAVIDTQDGNACKKTPALLKKNKQTILEGTMVPAGRCFRSVNSLYRYAFFVKSQKKSFPTGIPIQSVAMRWWSGSQ